MIKAAQLLPEIVKAAIRPWYRKLRGIRTEKKSHVDIRHFLGFEIAFREGTTDEVIIRNGASYKIEVLVPQYKPRPEDIIVNIGAHIGVAALMASQDVPNGKIYAIEASRETFNFLRINAALNRLDNISPHHLAITDKAGLVILYHDTGHWGHSITKQLSTRFEVVEGVTLEEFLAKNKIGNCGLLYLNCEGAEFPILLSTASATLRKIEYILADVHPHLWTDNGIDDLVAHLNNSGFVATVMEKEGAYDRVLAVRSL